MSKIRFFLLFLSFIFCYFESFAQRKGLNETLAEQYFYDMRADSQSLAAIFGRYKDSLVYVDFWASWCRPCLDELPHSRDLAQKLAGQPIVFLYLSMDENDDIWQKTVKKQPFAANARHYRRGLSAAQPLLAQLLIYAIPHYLLLDKTGKIINRDATTPSQKATLKYIRKWLQK